MKCQHTRDASVMLREGSRKKRRARPRHAITARTAVIQIGQRDYMSPRNGVQSGKQAIEIAYAVWA
jgi:hypothetical protein